jgi:LytS/YehU family sensor histidine kinase
MDITHDQRDVHLRITNDGPILPGKFPESESTAGLGLRATRERLSAFYGGDHQLNIERREEGGVVVAIRLPFRA